MVELTTQQVAEILGCSESTVRRMEEEGKLPSIKTENGHRRFDLFTVLSVQNQSSGFVVKSKLSLNKVKLGTLRKAVDSFADFDDNVELDMTLEEYSHPQFRSLMLCSKDKGHQAVI